MLEVLPPRPLEVPSLGRPRAGVFSMRTIVFFDGQNLYHLAREAWAPVPPVAGSPYAYPSYDVQRLAEALCVRDPQRALTQIRFYTGVPSPKQHAFWHGFWSNKLRFLRSQGVYVYKGRVNPGGQEKGVDVSMAVDLVALTYDQAYEAAILVSQDWDLGPAVALAKKIARAQGRTLTFESAFPFEAGRGQSPRGVPGCNWIHVDKALYDSCRDTTDYRTTPTP